MDGEVGHDKQDLFRVAVKSKHPGGRKKIGEFFCEKTSEHLKKLQILNN